MTSVGVVVVHTGGVQSQISISKRIARGMSITPSGRVLAVTYQMSKNWAPSICIEDIATRTVLDPAGSRGDAEDWEFSGNLAVRVCEAKPDKRCIKSEMGVILFRRSGDKPYVRRRLMSEQQVDSARLDALHPVFTRDIANNVWHLEKRDHLATLTQRLGALLAWSDELIAVVAGSTAMVQVAKLDLDGGLIGVPTKIDYPWALPLLDFGATD